jgi:glutathione peroxidase
MLLGDIKIKLIDGSEINMSEYAGKVLAIVNVASQCGFTPQYAGLEALYQQYRDKGLIVLGVPCNQFGGQEPGSAEEIAAFCTGRYAVSFPLMAKVDVNGDAAHPLWRWLRSSAPGVLGSERIKWNFTKFLVGRDGRVLRRYAPTTPPRALAEDIDAALAA